VLYSTFYVPILSSVSYVCRGTSSWNECIYVVHRPAAVVRETVCLLANMIQAAHRVSWTCFEFLMFAGYPDRNVFLSSFTKAGNQSPPFPYTSFPVHNHEVLMILFRLTKKIPGYISKHVIIASTCVIQSRHRTSLLVTAICLYSENIGFRSWSGVQVLYLEFSCSFLSTTGNAGILS
jgi:hypothetical protein